LKFQIQNLLDESHQAPEIGDEIIRGNGLKWVRWGNDKGSQAGLFPQRMAQAYQNSKTLRSVLTQQANLVASPLTTESEILQRKIDKYTSPRTRYDLRQLIYRVALDVQLHGEGFIKEVRYIEYAGNTPIKERSFAMHLDASQVRFSSDVDEFLEPTAVWISANWKHYTRQKYYRPYQLPLAGYGYEDFYDEQDRVYKKVCVHRVRDFEPAMNIYGKANWSGSYWSVLLEPLLGKFNYYHLNNSIHLSGILNIDLPFMPDEDTAKEIRDRIRENLKGENGGPSTAVNITGGDGKMEMLNYPLPQDGAWKDLNRTCERNIIMAAGWHPSLMGIEESGKLGNAVREVESHHRRVMTYMIEPLQQRILNTYLNTLADDYADLAEEFPIRFENKPMFTALDYVSQAKVDEAIPIEEIQKELGYGINDSE